MISKLVLGTVQMGMDYGVNNQVGKITRHDSFSILLKAHQLGVSMLDTAEVYGDAHHVIGSFHKEYPEHQFKVFTKLPAKSDKINVEDKINQYIRELHVPKLEGVLFHSFDNYKSNEDVTKQLRKLKEDGKVGMVGVSIYTNQQAEVLIDDPLIDIIQLPFNLLDNIKQRGDVLRKAKEVGKVVQSRSAFLQGLFFKDSQNDKSILTESLKDELNEIKRICDNNQCPMNVLALQYCLKQEGIHQVLVGVDSLHHLIQNIEASSTSIQEELLNQVDLIKVKNIEFLNPSLWIQS